MAQQEEEIYFEKKKKEMDIIIIINPPLETDRESLIPGTYAGYRSYIILPLHRYITTYINKCMSLC